MGMPHTTNHGKVVHKRTTKSQGLDVLIYYWDDRDGDDLCGWWFGPIVGGNHVWAYHPRMKSDTPPAKDWYVPHDGPIDENFRVQPQTASNKSGDAKDSKDGSKKTAKKAAEPEEKKVSEAPAKAKKEDRSKKDTKKVEEDVTEA